MIYHYTSIDTLALILSTKKIRFTRLDKVDDVLESSLLKESHYVFVSCWTQTKTENISLWNMYAKNMKGVRLSFPSNPFKKYSLKKGKYGIMSVLQDILDSPITIEEMFNEKYFIFPLIEKTDFFKSVTYLNDTDLESTYEDIIARKKDGITLYTEKFGFLKHERWQFQDECRFALKITPPYIDARNLIKVIDSNTLPPFEYFDLDIDPNELSKIEVKLGPHCSDSDEIIVNSLLDSHGINQVCEESNLKGIIRK
ncbi:DUF2971 domain-containing protein [Labilibaculum euxinus]|uniref:DUF2971 domain-containing protein n=1 Tax=Labilibaculum euxinus TaxID=2686357 RepID=A0A7M4DBV3_9BACT|nr:DUF2971 domain-containing protein [Labilibaculum euxinus]MUP40132.1 DUF2971 domain-containing protein [Labilibaculum euxinus]MVB09337.1 DUF2971 domain-containing protein [Labilibaculum euxinus]